MAGDVWKISLIRLRSWLAKWHGARIGAIPRSPDRLHAYRVALLHQELLARWEIDRLCHEWIAGKPIQMKRLSGRNPDWAALLYDRFAEAERFGATCLDNPPVAATTEADALTFLLIEHWAADGADSWRRLVDE